MHEQHSKELAFPSELRMKYHRQKAITEHTGSVSGTTVPLSVLLTHSKDLAWIRLNSKWPLQQPKYMQYRRSMALGLRGAEFQQQVLISAWGTAAGLQPSCGPCQYLLCSAQLFLVSVHLRRYIKMLSSTLLEVPLFSTSLILINNLWGS